MMNIWKSFDYGEMFVALDHIIETEMLQMELYCEIRKTVSRRSKKVAAVAAAEYLTKKYPDVQGFSPRDLRWLRDYYHAYEDQPTLLSLALQLGWTQKEHSSVEEMRLEYALFPSRSGRDPSPMKMCIYYLDQAERIRPM